LRFSYSFLYISIAAVFFILPFSPFMLLEGFCVAVLLYVFFCYILSQSNNLTCLQNRIILFGEVFSMAKTFSFGGFTSGQIFQLGYIVPDVDASMQFYAEAMRIGPFTCSRGFKAPDGWYRGSTDMPELTISHAYTGRLFIEFIQQHDDTPSVYKEHIDRYGYGLHHLGLAIAPEDYDAALDHYYSLGFENIFTDNLPGGVRIRYIGPKTDDALEKLRNEAGVCYLECVEVKESESGFFGAMIEAAKNWDGKTLLRQR